jgi:hypothetical protein
MSLEREEPKGGAEEQLAALFAAYREACPDPDPSPEFMPMLWQRIDAGRSFSYSLKRLAQGFITAAAAAALIMGVYLVRPDSRPSPTYLELLAAGNAHYDLADTEIVQALHENSR